MKNLLFKTYQPKKEEIAREWRFLDAKDQVLGRLATKIAIYLSGKDKKTLALHLDTGDFVVVTNAKDVKVTGKKEEQKNYYRHSGYPGGLKTISYKKLKEENPTKIIEHAVFNMLPKNRLRDQRMRRLKVFAGSEHPYVEKIGKA